MGKDYEISIVVITYYSDLNKTLQTIKSAIDQKNTSVEIVVADDGSDQNNFSAIEEYFKQRGFSDYIMLPHKQNQGTVKNVIDGVKASNGKYIKVIGAGDFLYDDNTLRNWIDFMKKSVTKWSFALAEFYSSDKALENTEVLNFPKNPEVYMEQDAFAQRVSYCAHENVGHGAAMLSEHDIMLRYLSYIDGQIKYAEDVIWRLMMFKGDVGRFYPEKTVYYEYGTGVSNSKSLKWIRKLLTDTRAIKREMFKIADLNDSEQVKLKKQVQKNFSAVIWKKLVGKAAQLFLSKKQKNKTKIKFIEYDNLEVRE